MQTVGSHHASQDTPFDPSDVRPSRLRDEIYNAAAREKTARAEEFSAIKRGLSKDTVVIADCANYIKGYRYQLWCEAKAVGTRCCVVHVAALEDDCRRWNEDRLRSWGRGEEIKQEPDTTARDVTRHGKDVLGDLQPESHTAIYGDRTLEQPSRSRSSSMDGGSDTPAQQQDDTMTLKSLYISSLPPPTATNTSNVTVAASTDHTNDSLPSVPIPPPTASPPYSPETLNSLCMRYEPPSPFSRWDTPLFTLPTTDTDPPYTQIWDAIFPPPTKPTSKKALSQQPARNPGTTTSASQTPTSTSTTAAIDEVRPHAATVLPTATAASALQTLESTTLLVVRALLAAAREQGAADGDGGVVSFRVDLPTSIPTPTSLSPATTTTNADVEESPDSTSTITIPPNTMLSQPLLQRLRRQYTQVQRGRIAHGQGYVGQVGGRAAVVEGFVRFLEGEIGEGE